MRSFVGCESSINRANERARVSFHCFPRNAHKRESFMRKVDRLPHSFKELQWVQTYPQLCLSAHVQILACFCPGLGRACAASPLNGLIFPGHRFGPACLPARLCRPRFALLRKNPQHQTPSLISHILDVISAHTKDSITIVCRRKGMANQQRKKVSFHQL